MPLADDLRQAAVDVAAMAITQALTGTGGTDPQKLAQAAVEASEPFLDDARRVDEALALREPVEPRSRRARPRPTPHRLWEEAAGDETAYLTLMEEHGWLALASMRVNGGTVTS